MALFFIFFALSGIVMNHRQFFSPVDVSRNWLPQEYRYNNWNNAAVKGSIEIGDDSVLIFGNIGIWLTNTGFTQFEDWNHGFPEGTDNRKVSDILQTPNGNLFAATLFGLFRFDSAKKEWHKTTLHNVESRIVALEIISDTLLVLTRSRLLLGFIHDNYSTFEVKELQAPPSAEKQVSLFRTIWVIHSGEILGLTGKLLVDLGGLAMILLSVTGLLFFVAPKWMRRIKRSISLKNKLKNTTRWSYQWHLKVGIIFAFLLFVASLTGMFLRPPLLIPIAGKEVKPLKYTHLDQPNYWDDKLRDIHYEPQYHGFAISTSDGMYFLNENLTQEPLRYKLQPPVSVMGISVFRHHPGGGYMVGSFSGIFHWNPYDEILNDFRTGQPVAEQSGLRSPFGELAVAGYHSTENEEWIFDYNAGAISKSGKPLPGMPTQILQQSGMSLWNLALEIHTWRILKFLIGDFYILVVPLAGILGIFIVISGVVMWVLRRRRKHVTMIKSVCSKNE